MRAPSSDGGRRILLASELGGGLGHAHKLLLVARALVGAGHRPLLVLPDASAARALGGELETRVAPPLERIPSAGALESMGDILAAAGFGGIERAAATVRRWRDLLDELRPAAVVGDYAPFLLVAAHRRVPRLAIGNGFTLPPANLPGYPTFSAERIHSHPALEATLDGLLGAVIPQRPPAPALLAGERHFVCVVPELDVFAGLRRQPAGGPLAAPVAAGPTPDGGLFAYLSAAAPACDAVLVGLARSGQPGGVFVRGGTAAQAALVAGSAVRWHDHPVPLARALATSALVVHHGGPNTAQDALFAGRPQLLVPETVEQVLQAEEVVALGVGRRLFTDELEPAQIAASVAELSSAAWRRSAEEQARALRPRYRGCAADVVAALEGLL